MSIQISREYFILLVKLNNGLFVMLISRGLHQKLMHTNLLSRSLYQKLMICIGVYRSVHVTQILPVDWL